MRSFAKHSACVAVAFMLVLSVFVGAVPASAEPLPIPQTPITTTPTGYTCAEDVVYVKDGNYIYNWGARGEVCTFLSSYADAFSDDNVLSAYSGGTGTSDAPGSELYSALKSLMESAHKTQTTYDGTKALYRYTDCFGNDTEQLSTFYVGNIVGSTWVYGGKTYNREHVWPKSKCINTSKKEDSADLMMLRPAYPNNNSSRNNKAYGESDGYYDPGVSVRGDCARIVLYGYVRWGNTSKMWGSSGVIENLSILLKWMEEDPVDTWEMGRNDAMQSITGTRNIFVDHPEYAWQLFGLDVPENLITPSGSNGSSTPTECQHDYVATVTDPTCTAGGYTTYTCALCGDSYVGDKTENLGHQYTETVTDATCANGGYTTHTCTLCGDSYVDSETEPTGVHDFGEWEIVTQPTVDKAGEEKRVCSVCGAYETRTIELEVPPECKHDYTSVVTEPTCTDGGYTTYTCALCGDSYVGDETEKLGHQYTETVTDATCANGGYTTHTCTLCGDSFVDSKTEPTGAHTFGSWQTVTESTTETEGKQTRVCSVCNTTESRAIEKLPTEPSAETPDGGNAVTIIVISVVAVCLIGGAVVFVIIRKKK